MLTDALEWPIEIGELLLLDHLRLLLLVHDIDDLCKVGSGGLIMSFILEVDRVDVGRILVALHSVKIVLHLAQIFVNLIIQI